MSRFCFLIRVSERSRGPSYTSPIWRKYGNGSLSLPSLSGNVVLAAVSAGASLAGVSFIGSSGMVNLCFNAYGTRGLDSIHARVREIANDNVICRRQSFCYAGSVQKSLQLPSG